MFKITGICSSHYIASDGDNEIFISLNIEDDGEHWWVVYCDDINESAANWFETKQEAFDYVESLFSNI